jgi:hypothetical protein
VQLGRTLAQASGAGAAARAAAGCGAADAPEPPFLRRLGACSSSLRLRLALSAVTIPFQTELNSVEAVTHMLRKAVRRVDVVELSALCTGVAAQRQTSGGRT